VPSKLFGEEVGCALVLSPLALEKPTELRELTLSLRALLKEKKLSLLKFPTVWPLPHNGLHRGW
jgi:hypothetical protein